MSIPKSSIVVSPTPFESGILFRYDFILFVEYGDLDPIPLIVTRFVLYPAEWEYTPVT